MKQTFRVLDCATNETVLVDAESPDAAARLVVECQLFRGLRGHDAIVRAKVYFDSPGQITTMVRFYVPRQAADTTR